MTEREEKYKKLLKEWDTPFTRTEREAWDLLQARIAEMPARPARVVQFNWKRWVPAAAAVLILAAFSWFWASPDRISEKTLPGTDHLVSLPDGSSAHLNAGSELSFSNSWTGDRRVELDGEAFFEVKKGKTFKVVTPQGEVQVLGTSFNVYCRNDKFTVACYTGKVQVSGNGNEVKIEPGEKVIYQDGTWNSIVFDPREPSWKEGYFEYVDEPLENVLRELERQFNISIEADQTMDRNYTGHFSDSSLEEALELVCTPMNFTWEIKKDMSVVLKTR